MKCENRYRFVLGLRTEPVIGPPLHVGVRLDLQCCQVHVRLRADRQPQVKIQFPSIKSIQFCRIGTSKAIQCGKGKPDRFQLLILSTYSSVLCVLYPQQSADLLKVIPAAQRLRCLRDERSGCDNAGHGQRWIISNFITAKFPLMIAFFFFCF